MMRDFRSSMKVFLLVAAVSVVATDAQAAPIWNIGAVANVGGSAGNLWLLSDGAPGTVVSQFYFIDGVGLTGMITSGPVAATSDYQMFMGDWNGDGTKTAGYRLASTGTYYLRNSNDSADYTDKDDYDVSHGYGGTATNRAGFVGDFDGDGDDTIGILTHSTYWYWNYTNDNATTVGSPTFGDYQYRCFLGDWDGNGTDTPGIFKDGTWILRNSWTATYADAYTGDVTITGLGTSDATTMPIIGDWNGDGIDTVGYTVANGAALEWNLAAANTTGAAVDTFNFGGAAYLPVAYYVPEPVTMGILSIGAVAVLFTKRRRMSVSQ